MEFPASEAEIMELVEELADQLGDLAKREAKPLVKSEKSEGSSEKSSAEKSLAKEETPEAEDSSGSEDSSASAAPELSGSPAEASAPPSEGAAPDAAAPPEAQPAPDEGAPPSVEQLVDMYRQLPPDQLQAHIEAVEALKAQMSAAAPPPPEAPAAPPPPAGPSASAAPPPAGPPDDMAFKSEVKQLEEKLAKADARITEVSGALEKTLECLAKATVQRKAVNGITVLPYLARQEEKPLKKSAMEMTEQERRDRLGQVAQSPKLTKHDRALINDYILAPGTVAPEKLEDLFNKVA